MKQNLNKADLVNLPRVYHKSNVTSSILNNSKIRLSFYFISTKNLLLNIV